MWGCDFLPFSGGWGGGIFPGGVFSMLLWLLIVATTIYVAIRIFSSHSRNSVTSSQDRSDSLQILKVRFAKGEISQEEFVKMKQVLSQSGVVSESGKNRTLRPNQRSERPEPPLADLGATTPEVIVS